MTRPRRLLFIRTVNRPRSPTAEAICQGVEGIEAISAGTNNDAEQPLTGDLIEWADVVIAMDREHRNRINRKFRQQMKASSSSSSVSPTIMIICSRNW